MQVKENFDVKNLTSFKCGGPIKRVFYPESVDEFEGILIEKPDIKVFGNLSNTLVSSFGYNGEIVITTKLDGHKIVDSIVEAECGLKGPKLSNSVMEAGLSGLEFMAAFPGTVGGEVFMNAGAHGQSVSDSFISAKCYSRDFGIVTIPKSQMDFSYRTSKCQKDNMIVLSALFELIPTDKEIIREKMNENLAFRKAHQPSLVLPNCGSVFRNPMGESAGRLLELSGAKLFASGKVHVWENHANFVINEGGSSEDILDVILKMRDVVREKFNIELKPEVRFLGDNDREVEICKNLKII